MVRGPSRSVLGLLGALVATGAVMSGCVDQGGGAKGPVEAAAPTPDVSSAGHEARTLPDGRHFGFISDVSDGVVLFEPAEFLTDGDAEAAAAADGAATGSGGLPNGVYIRRSGQTIQIPIADNAEVSIIDDTGDELETRSVSTDVLNGLYSGQKNSSWVYASLPEWPVHVSVDSGLVIGVIQQYLP